MLRFLTSGESHGPLLAVILDGVPSGVALDVDKVNEELSRRQQGYGRGGRQKIEADTVEIVGGLRHGITSGAPLALMLPNRDFENWRHVMSPLPVDADLDEVRDQLSQRAITCFRPGHADLPGTLKFHQADIRDVLERASARETAARVAAGAVCEQILSCLGIEITAHVVQVGTISSGFCCDSMPLSRLHEQVCLSEMFCADKKASKLMEEAVRSAWQEGDSIGGVVEILSDGLPVGLGSYTQWDQRLDGQLAQAVMSVQAIKAVEIGDGIQAAGLAGSQVHDALYPVHPGHVEAAGGRVWDVGNGQNILPFCRRTNHAGGIEGGMTNGARLKLRAYMKPIPTLRKGLPSVSFGDFQAVTAHYERSDVCAVPSAAIVVKAMTSFVLCRALLAKFGSDSIQDIATALETHRRFCQNPALPERPGSGRLPQSILPCPNIDEEMDGQ